MNKTFVSNKYRSIQLKKWTYIMSNLRENIRSTRRTVDEVLPNLSTNKMLLFMQMWHDLVILIFNSLYWLGSSLTHLYKWHYLIDWEDHINSTPDRPNNFSLLILLLWILMKSSPKILNEKKKTKNKKQNKKTKKLLEKSSLHEERNIKFSFFREKY